MDPSPFFKPLPSRPDGKAGPVTELLVLAALTGAIYLIRPWAAGVVGSIGLALWVASRGSCKVEKFLKQATTRISWALGEAILHLTLLPLYVLVFPVLRLFLGRQQLLDLRREDRVHATNWTPVPGAQERHRHLYRPFTREARSAGGVRLLPLLARATAVLLMLLGIAEVGLRWRGYGTPVVYEAHPQIGYYPSPHQEIRRSGNEILINSAGMRSSHDPSKPAEPGTYRLFMIGDSTLYGGSYVDQQDLYASRLQDLVNREPSRYLPKGFHRLQVLPMGVNAWGPHHMLGYLKVFGTFQANELWVMGPVCDVERPLYGLEALPFFSSKHKPWFALEEALLHGIRRFGSRGPAEASHETTRQGIEAYRQILALDVPARIFFLPTKEENRNRRLEMNLELRAAVEPRLETLFLEEGGKELYWDGFHLNREGHAVYARALSAFLEKRAKDHGGR